MVEEGHEVVVGAAPPPAGFAGLLSRIQSDSYRTLRWLAGLVAGVAALRLAATLLGGESLGPFRWGLGLLALVSLPVALASTRDRLPPRAFPALALGFEVAVGLALATQLLGWQSVLGPEGWPLAAVPTVAVWIIVFSSVIPLPPAQHLLGIVLAGLGVPVAFFVSLGLFEVPPEVGPEQNLRVFLQLVVPTFIASAIAFQTARRAYGLSLGWTDARRMGSYELIGKVGEGGMGEVWRARHRLLKRPAAVKLIRGGGAGPDYASQLARFEREIQVTVGLSSPHTISVYDYGTTPDGTFYYVMELLDGLDLETLVTRHGPQPPERVVALLRQACDSLGEAHAAGLVHRDVKAANIFLCRYGRDLDFVKLLDFGMVRELSTEEGLTRTGTFAGTPHYASPEQAEGLLDRVDARSDIYALGCVAYWLLAGRTPFTAPTELQLLMKQVKEPPEPPSAVVGGVPPALDALVLDCLAKERAARPASTGVLDERLAAVPLEQPWTAERAAAWWSERTAGRLS